MYFYVESLWENEKGMEINGGNDRKGPECKAPTGWKALVAE